MTMMNKEMNFPITIILDENGVNKLGQQTYKIEIEDNKLKTNIIDSSDLKELLKKTDDVLWKLISKKSNISSELSKEEKIQIYLDRLDEAYHEGTYYALQIVNNLLQEAYEKSIKPTGNKYVLSITPMIEYILKDWFQLWDRPFRTHYEIAGNEVFVIISNEIPSIIEGNGEKYIDAVMSKQIFDQEYYKDITLTPSYLKALGYKEDSNGWSMLFKKSNLLLIIEGGDYMNYQFWVSVYHLDDFHIKKFHSRYLMNTIVDLDNIYKKLELI